MDVNEIVKNIFISQFCDRNGFIRNSKIQILYFPFFINKSNLFFRLTMVCDVFIVSIKKTIFKDQYLKT